MPTVKVSAKTKDPVLMTVEEFSGLFSSLVGVARQKLGQKQPSWIYDERASLLLPVWYLAQEQELEAATIENSLKDDVLRAIVKIEGNPVDFNKNSGQYWKKIIPLLGLR